VLVLNLLPAKTRTYQPLARSVPLQVERSDYTNLIE